MKKLVVMSVIAGVAVLGVGAAARHGRDMCAEHCGTPDTTGQHCGCEMDA